MYLDIPFWRKKEKLIEVKLLGGAFALRFLDYKLYSR